MTITLTMKEDWELWAEANHNSPQQPERKPFGILREMPQRLGKGYIQDIEVHPHLFISRSGTSSSTSVNPGDPFTVEGTIAWEF